MQHLTFMIAAFLVLLTLGASQDIHSTLPPQKPTNASSVAVQQPNSARPIYKHNNSAVAPQISMISINETIIYPRNLRKVESRCFGSQTLKIQNGESMTIRANRPFIAFFKTKTATHYYDLEDSNQQNKIVVNYLVQSKAEGEMFSVTIPLGLKCNYITHPYLNLVGNIHLDFYEDSVEKKHAFEFIIVCASEEVNQDFLTIYKPGYVLFWVYFNLVLQIYNGYNRDRTHLALFLIFLGSSLVVEDQLYGYIVSVSLFLMVLLRERREGKLNVKVFSLYLTFFMLAMTLIIFAYSAQADGSDWNSLWIAIENFMQIHITMFMILRLLKLHRLRAVFWYFIAVCLFATLYGDNNNIFFSLNFKSPLDLSCLKANLFFPLMMLPISNYFTSLTSWMHRVIGAALTLSSVLPLKWAIITMMVVIVCVEIFQIKTKSLQVIKHTY